jgi:hypothetical protein
LAEARPSVKEFYWINHLLQTRNFVSVKKAGYLPLRKKRMGVWARIINSSIFVLNMQRKMKLSSH